MTENVLQILGIIDREDTITNMLKYGINNNPVFADKFMTALANSDEIGSFAEVSAETRKRVTGGVPDLLVSGIGPEGPFIIVVENKIKAGEGKDQTSRYFKAKKEIKNNIANSRQDKIFIDPKISFVFLTLNPNEKPSDRNFYYVNYENILDKLGNEPLGKNKVLNYLWHEFTEATRDYYQASKVTGGDLVLEKWSDSDGGPFRKNFLHFETVFKMNLNLGIGLKVDKVFKSKAWGTPVFQAMISKDEWKYPVREPAKADLSKGLGYNIHIEPTLRFKEKGKAELHIFLHYEHRTYRTGKEEERIPEDLKSSYYKTREKFVAAIAEMNLREFKMRGGRNQVGVKVMKLNDEISLSEFLDKIESVIEALGDNVDSCLNQINLK